MIILLETYEEHAHTAPNGPMEQIGGAEVKANRLFMVRRWEEDPTFSVPELIKVITEKLSSQ